MSLFTLLQRKRKRRSSTSMTQTVLIRRATSRLGDFENLHESNETKKRKLPVNRNAKRLSDGVLCQRNKDSRKTSNMPRSHETRSLKANRCFCRNIGIRVLSIRCVYPRLFTCITSSYCCRTKRSSRDTTLQRLRNRRWMSLSFHRLCR